MKNEKEQLAQELIDTLVSIDKEALEIARRLSGHKGGVTTPMALMRLAWDVASQRDDKSLADVEQLFHTVSEIYKLAADTMGANLPPIFKLGPLPEEEGGSREAFGVH